MKNAIKFIIILLALWGCKQNPSEYSKNVSGDYHSAKITGGVKMNLDIKSKKITSLHDIEARFTLKNMSAQKITYGFSSGCQSGYKIKRNQDTILDSTKELMCTMSLTSFSLKQGESKTIPISLQSRDNKDLEKGKYTLKAFLLDHDDVEISTSFKVR